MLQMTTAAGEHLRQMLQNVKADAEQFIRLVPTETGLAPKLDQLKTGDETFKHDGRTVLVVSPQVGEALTSKKLDAKQSDDQSTLVLVDA